MNELIIGGHGRIGSKMREHLPQAPWTTRRHDEVVNAKIGNIWYFDLLKPEGLQQFPQADVVYLCAGVDGTLTVANDFQRAYKTNVDGTIAVAEFYRDKAHVVWLSSTTVYWMTEKYGEFKRLVELHLRAMPHVGIIRAGRVTADNIDDLCMLMIGMGRNRVNAIVPWNEDEKPYVA